MKLILLANIVLIVLALFATQYVFSKEMPFGISTDVDSPSDRIKEEQIKAYEDKVEINFDRKIRFVKFVDTNSMDPVLDSDTNAVEVFPNSPNEVKRGDIVSYKSSRSVYPVIHRVVQTSMDNDGWYAIVKGDNNPEEDPEKVRFEQINGVVVALFY